MNDEIASASLVAFLDRLGLPQAARDRVVEIDRKLAGELESNNLDGEGCAALVIEAADLIADCGPSGFEWSGWDAEDYPGDADGFDLDNMEWGED
ncbi:MAG: hypothetical protein ACRECW_06405 [Phyllobacterium sp.]